jgi:hypothetical protein
VKVQVLCRAAPRRAAPRRAAPRRVKVQVQMSYVFSVG